MALHPPLVSNLCLGKSRRVSILAILCATHAIDAVWRIESPRLIAGIAGVVRDIGLAEELAQDALVAALEQWPESGVPRNPGAWLMAIGKRRAIDRLRRQERFGRKLDEIGRTLETETLEPTDEVAGALDQDIQDDLLRLVFTACHPVRRGRSGDQAELPCSIHRFAPQGGGQFRVDRFEGLVSPAVSCPSR